MSMQSLLVSNNCASLLEAIVAGEDYSPALAQAMEQFCASVVAWRVELRRELRELPDLKRGVKSQQYPMFGAAWPYIRSRHWHYRKQKQRDFHSTHIYGKGTIYWKNDGEFMEYAVHDYDKYSLRADSDRHPCESAYEKRIAKRVSNKRRRAEDKREIAREMDLWAQDNEYKIDTEECLTFSVARGNINLLAQDYGACNVYVPPHPQCFDGRCTYGNVPVRAEPEFNPRNFDDYYSFHND